MNDQYWSWILALLGLAGFYVTGKKIWWGWWLNVAAQTVWYAYAIVTQQWGFLVMTTMYTVIFTKNALEWTIEHRAKQSVVSKLKSNGPTLVLSDEEIWRKANPPLPTHERERVKGEGEVAIRICPWDCPDECDHKPEGILKYEFVVDMLGYQTDEEMQARIDAQVQGWLDELPSHISKGRVEVFMEDSSLLSPHLKTVTAVIRK